MALQHTRPLPDTHPEFSILQLPGLCEYRVENWSLRRDGSGRVNRSSFHWCWQELLAAPAVSFWWLKGGDSRICQLVVAVWIILLVWFKCSQVVFESVILFPPHGIQLETHRGILSTSLFKTRRFIPISALEDTVINEGLRGWNVRYFLALIRSEKTGGSSSIEIAFQNIQPRFPVLLKVYHAIQDVVAGSTSKE